MTPKLFAGTATQFDNEGIGRLVDATRCEVYEERNGAFELELDYPITGHLYGQIGRRSIIVAAPNPTADAQPFRVYRITRPINGVVTIYAQHISYDLSGIPVRPYTAPNIVAALDGLVSNAAVTNPFAFSTDKTTAGTFAVAQPESSRALLGGMQGSILDVYGGGEYVFDKFSVRLLAARGQDRGVVIRYGKNLTDLTQEESDESQYTGVYAYWYDEESGALVETSPRVLYAAGTYDYTKVRPLDLSGEFEDAPTAAQLKTRAQAYINSNNIAAPAMTLDVAFVALESLPEYKSANLREQISLCDTVTIIFEALGVSATAKIVATRYDALQDRYTELTIGDAKQTIAGTIAGQQMEITQSRRTVSTAMQRAIATATRLITGNSGGYVVLHSSTGGDTPDEILIMDTADINTATKVWRWNRAGLGYSSTGYNGPYGLAITQNGAIVADYITSGTLDASRATITNISANNITTGTLNGNNVTVTNLNASNIKSGTLQSADGRTTLALSGGKFKQTASDDEYTTEIYDATLKMYYGASVGTSGYTTWLESGLLMIPEIEVYGFGSSHKINPDSSSHGNPLVTIGALGTHGAVVVYSNTNTNSFGDFRYNKLEFRPTTTTATTVNAAFVAGSVSGAYSLVRGSSSSRRYKKAIKSLKDGAIDIIRQLRPVHYKARKGYGDPSAPDREYMGMIAEEVADVLPEAVIYEDGKPEALAYDRITVPLVKAVQELADKVDKLTARVVELEGKK